MKKLTLLAATAAAAVLATDAPAADKPAKKTKPEAKPAAAQDASAKTDKAPAAPAEKPFVLTDPVAVVDGEEIKIADVEKVIASLLSQQGGTLKDVPEAMKPELYRNVVDGVIVEKLVTKNAKNVEVPEADVAAELEKFKSQFGEGKNFDEQLKAQGQTLDGIKGDIRRFLQQNRWIDSVIKDKVQVSDTEVETFYKENPDNFKEPEQVRASHILVRLEKDAKDDEVKTKQAAANKILDRVKKGEDFAKLATELSEDPSAKDNKGDLDFFPREQMVPEFSEAAFKMKKGEVSPAPVRSDFGFHIIKVTDRK